MNSASDDPSHDGSDAAADVEGVELTIQQTSELLGVPSPTIRSWERRYGVPVVDRSTGGHRRYARAQLDQLLRMRDLVRGGRRPAEAATLVQAGYATAPEPLVDAFLQAALQLAPSGITRTLDNARETLGLDRTVDEVLLPAMRKVGDEWRRGRVDISHEHVATHASQVWLAAIPTVQPVRPQPPIILSCGPLDHHTLGLEAIGALLRRRQWDCRVLGARTPAPSLARAVVETDAVAVVLVCHLAGGRAAAVEALRSPQLQQRPIFYAGGAFVPDKARQGVPGRYLGTHITQAADLITTFITSTASR